MTNPYSPFADAAPECRHLFASLFGIDPPPGKLCIAACGGMAVVRADKPLTDSTEAVLDGDTAALPDDICPSCVRAAQQLPVPAFGESGRCELCEMDTNHGPLCALCRQQLHDAWVTAGSPEGKTVQELVGDFEIVDFVDKVLGELIEGGDVA